MSFDRFADDRGLRVDADAREYLAEQAPADRAAAAPHVPCGATCGDLACVRVRGHGDLHYAPLADGGARWWGDD